MSRILYNRAIVEKLEKLVDKYPDIRFGQLLMCSDIITGSYDENNKFNITDPFYEEPEVTWKRMCRNYFVFEE